MRVFCLALLLAACPSPDEPADPVDVPAPVDDGWATCPPETRVGGFAVEPAATYTTVTGAVADGVAPAAIFEVALQDGDCALWHPRELFCDPRCEAGFTCDVGNTCVSAPRNVDVGPVAVDGLTADVAMDAIPPVNIYNFVGDLPHPAYGPGDRVELYTGEGRGGPSMVAFGIEDLQTDAADVPLLDDADTALRWTPPAADVDARVTVSIDIANHGGVPGKVVCTTADDGELDVASALVSGLLDLGWSGFPTVTLARSSSDVADADAGCFDFAVRSTVVLPAVIEGLTSCSDPDDCPPDQTCLPDLTCG